MKISWVDHVDKIVRVSNYHYDGGDGIYDRTEFIGYWKGSIVEVWKRFNETHRMYMVNGCDGFPLLQNGNKNHLDGLVLTEMSVNELKIKEARELEGRDAYVVNEEIKDVYKKEGLSTVEDLEDGLAKLIKRHARGLFPEKKVRSVGEFSKELVGNSEVVNESLKNANVFSK